MDLEGSNNPLSMLSLARDRKTILSLKKEITEIRVTDAYDDPNYCPPA
jgi:hypothetical protein